MKCWYSLDKVKGLRKMMALTVVYENDRHYPERSLRTLNNVTHPRFYERDQVESEELSAKYYSRLFTTYSYFFKDFENVEALAAKCIEDDRFFKVNEVEALIFKEELIKAIATYYDNDLQFRKKKKGKVSNQILIAGI